MRTTLNVSLVILISLLLSAEIALTQEVEQAKVDLNFATLEELQTLPGITAQLAEAIVTGRLYVSLEDLLHVEGMTEEIVAGIQDLSELTMLNVNYATLEELLLLPGVTPEIANAIIAGRPYFTIDNLLNVVGINQEMLTTIQKYADASLENKQKKSRGTQDRDCENCKGKGVDDEFAGGT